MGDVRLRRIVAVGLGCALAAIVLGVVIERARLGANDRAAFALVERDVRGRFDAITAALRSISGSVARVDLIDSATSPSSVRELMDLRAQRSRRIRTSGGCHGFGLIQSHRLERPAINPAVERVSGQDPSFSHQPARLSPGSPAYGHERNRRAPRRHYWHGVGASR